MVDLASILISTAILTAHSVGVSSRKHSDFQYQAGSLPPRGGIVSKAGQFRVREGETVEFPCKTVNQGDAVITWHWAGELVSAGDVKVLSEDRVHIMEGGRILRIENITLNDRGVLSCKLNLKSFPVHVNHTLEILVPPIAEILGGQKVINLTESARLELSCLGRGYPKPTVSWSKQGVQTEGIQGGSIVLPEVRKQDGGMYRCTASSDLGYSSDTITVHILYKPVVKLERKYTDEKNIFTLACSVESNPPSQVSWTKDGAYLKTENYAQLQGGSESEGGEHILSITSLDETDYGNYTCEAINSIGKSTQTLELKGQPGKPVVMSPGQSFSSKDYTLVWTVWTPSNLPIMNQSILYRLRNKASGMPVLENEGTWHNLALISDTASLHGKDKDEFRMDLTGLQGDAEYEVRIRAMNHQGWSQLSDPFLFKTSGKHYTLEFPLFTKHQLTSTATTHYGQPGSPYHTCAITAATAIITYQTLTSNFIY